MNGKKSYDVLGMVVVVSTCLAFTAAIIGLIRYPLIFTIESVMINKP